jgi:nucleoside-diphosphate-sugar epimerase
MAAYADQMKIDSTRARTCLIVGCGYVGARLARRCITLRPVVAMVRTAASAEALIRMGISTITADLDGDSDRGLLGIPPDVSAVMYLAPPSGTGKEDLRLMRFLEALGDLHPEVLVYFSTTGVYGNTGGATVDEHSPVAPGDDRSRQRLDAEGRVKRWCQERGVRGVIFRVPAIYGPGRLPLERLQRGEPVLRSEDSGPGNRIQVDDLVDACATALVRPVAGIFNLSDGQPEPMAAFTTRVAKWAGLPEPRQVPWAEAERLLSPGLLSFLRESRLVTSCRRDELGWTPRYGNLDEGIRASLREMGLATWSEG